MCAGDVNGRKALDEATRWVFEELMDSTPIA